LRPSKYGKPHDPKIQSFCCFSLGCPSEHFNELVNANVDGSILPTENDAFRCGVARLQKDKPQFVIGGETSKLQEFPFAVLLVTFVGKF
jgi:hypothetical protein